MVDERLNGLALMYVHRDIEINIDAVINRFALGNKRSISNIL